MTPPAIEKPALKTSPTKSWVVANLNMDQYVMSDEESGGSLPSELVILIFDSVACWGGSIGASPADRCEYAMSKTGLNVLVGFNL
jgi:hypothetical protein